MQDRKAGLQVQKVQKQNGARAPQALCVVAHSGLGPQIIVLMCSVSHRENWEPYHLKVHNHRRLQDVLKRDTPKERRCSAEILEACMVELVKEQRQVLGGLGKTLRYEIFDVVWDSFGCCLVL